MTAFNVVRFRAKPGREEEFVSEHRKFVDEHRANFPPGFRRGTLVHTGERTYCFIGEWDDFTSIVGARPFMIGNLDRLRDTLEDLGGGLGVTDPASGEAVVEMTR